MGRPKKIVDSSTIVDVVEAAVETLEDLKQASYSPRSGTFKEDGLRNGIDYVYNEIGLVDWPKMIDKQYIVANRFNFENRKQAVPSNIDDLEDKDKLILLAGFKNIALLRGYKNVIFNPFHIGQDLVSLECQITWKGNYETGYEDVTYSGLADASAYNTESFAKIYLTAIAENRAFVRAVRNFLNIPILGKDELGPSKKSTAEETAQAGAGVSVGTGVRPAKAYDLLTNKLKERGRSFEQLKKRLIADGFDAKDWDSESDIPSEFILKIVGTYFDK